MSGRLYNSALSFYRGSRRLKNRILNLIDYPVVVLVYHRVTVLQSDPQLLAVSPDHFRRQMQYLKQNFQIVRFEEDWSGLHKPAVAVTFDDGYADNALEALPILEEEKVPATFFISTGSIGSRYEFWWDELERLILGDQETYPGEFHLDDPGYGRTWQTKTPMERKVLYKEIYPLMYPLKEVPREQWLEQLRDWGGFNQEGREAYRPLSHDEAKMLGQSPYATIGAHTVSHTPLFALTADEQRREIVSSKEYLEQLLGSDITVFSYPFGRKCDYNADSRRVCQKAGFYKAAANFSGQAHRWTDSFQIPRQLVRDWDIDTFTAELKSFWA